MKFKMKTRILAIFLVVLCSFTTLTACGSDNLDTITQIEDDFAALVQDAADLTLLLMSAIAAGIDVTPYMDTFNQIMSYINQFALSSLSTLTEGGLDMVVDQLDNMKTLLDNLKTSITNALDGLGGIVTPASQQDLTQINSGINEMKTTLNELKTMLENMVVQ